MSTAIFFINALSNLHVGSGEINYGLVDNLIQRDPVTGLPTINSSSLKGALREHFEKISPNVNVDVKRIFGSDPKSKDRNPGLLRFFDADLIGIPVRTTGGNFPYVFVSSKENLSRIRKRLDTFGINAQYLENIGDLPKTQNKPEQKVEIEDLQGKYQYATTGKFKEIIDERIAIVGEKELDILCNNEHLPVISRNCLENGISTNLFYEQVLPRYSRLCTVIMGPDKKPATDEKDDEFEAFCKALENQVVQIGGNATIGYGYCKFSTLNTAKQ